LAIYLFQGDGILEVNVGIRKYKAPRQTIKVIAPLSFKDLNMKCPFLYYGFVEVVGAAEPDF
jgi:hypothetical protein